jgi:hypothetical protein
MIGHVEGVIIVLEEDVVVETAAVSRLVTRAPVIPLLSLLLIFVVLFNVRSWWWCVRWPKP